MVFKFPVIILFSTNLKLLHYYDLYKEYCSWERVEGKRVMEVDACSFPGIHILRKLLTFLSMMFYKVITLSLKN